MANTARKKSGNHSELVDEWAEKQFAHWLLRAEPQVRAQFLSLLDDAWLATRFSRAILAAVRELHQPGEVLDLLQMHSWLQSGSWNGAVPSVADLVPDTEDGFVPDTAVSHLRELHHRRQLLKLGQHLADRTVPVEHLIREGLGILRELQSAGGSTSVFMPLDEVLIETAREMESKDVTEVKTGLVTLDNKVGGLLKSGLTVIGARPSIGKTAVLLRFARGAAERGHGVAIISLEMRSIRLANRLLSDVASIENQQLQRGIVNDDEMPQLMAAFKRLNPLPIYLCDRSLPWWRCLTEIETLKSQRPEIDVVMVDYIGLVRGVKAERRDMELAQITRDMKRMAIELNIAAVAVSQLKRRPEDAQDHHPSLGDFRESGAIEQDTDTALLLYREGHYSEAGPDNEIEVLVAKQRDGRTGKLVFYWDGTYTRIADLDREGATP